MGVRLPPPAPIWIGKSGKLGKHIEKKNLDVMRHCASSQFQGVGVPTTVAPFQTTLQLPFHIPTNNANINENLEEISLLHATHAIDVFGVSPPFVVLFCLLVERIEAIIAYMPMKNVERSHPRHDNGRPVQFVFVAFYRLLHESAGGRILYVAQVGTQISCHLSNSRRRIGCADFPETLSTKLGDFPSFVGDTNRHPSRLAQYIRKVFLCRYSITSIGSSFFHLHYPAWRIEGRQHHQQRIQQSQFGTVEKSFEVVNCQQFSPPVPDALSASVQTHLSPIREVPASSSKFEEPSKDCQAYAA